MGATKGMGEWVAAGAAGTPVKEEMVGHTRHQEQLAQAEVAAAAAAGLKVLTRPQAQVQGTRTTHLAQVEDQTFTGKVLAVPAVLGEFLVRALVGREGLAGVLAEVPQARLVLAEQGAGLGEVQEAPFQIIS